MEKTISNDVKLYYFNFNGIACPIRALLGWKKVEFEDIQYDLYEWRKENKHSGLYEFEVLPILEYKGEKIVESMAIYIYLGRKFGLLGSSVEEEYVHISNIAMWKEFFFSKFALVVLPEGDDIPLQPERAKQFHAVHAPFWLQKIEARFKKYGGKYFFGDSISLSDFLLGITAHFMFKNDARKDTWESLLLENAPTFAKHVDWLMQNDFAEYLAKYYVKSPY